MTTPFHISASRLPPHIASTIQHESSRECVDALPPSRAEQCMLCRCSGRGGGPLRLLRGAAATADREHAAAAAQAVGAALSTPPPPLAATSGECELPPVSRCSAKAAAWRCTAPTTPCPITKPRLVSDAAEAGANRRAGGECAAAAALAHARRARLGPPPALSGGQPRPVGGGTVSAPAPLAAGRLAELRAAAAAVRAAAESDGPPPPQQQRQRRGCAEATHAGNGGDGGRRGCAAARRGCAAATPPLRVLEGLAVSYLRSFRSVAEVLGVVANDVDPRAAAASPPWRAAPRPGPAPAASDGAVVRPTRALPSRCTRCMLVLTTPPLPMQRVVVQAAFCLPLPAPAKPFARSCRLRLPPQPAAASAALLTARAGRGRTRTASARFPHSRHI